MITQHVTPKSCNPGCAKCIRARIAKLIGEEVCDEDSAPAQFKAAEV